MRWEVVQKFNSLVKGFSLEISDVALVGGGPNEPELRIIDQIGSASVTFFGIQKIPNENFEFLDLNTDTIFEKEFDLVICSQVIEHVWNQDMCFNILARLVKPGGLLWIGCPASNYAHGSPDYFSAGFTATYLEKNFSVRNFEPVASGNLGSKRYYFLTHALQIWGSRNLHKFPLFFGISRHYPRELLGRLVALTISPKVTSDIKFATETFALFKKN